MKVSRTYRIEKSLVEDLGEVSRRTGIRIERLLEAVLWYAVQLGYEEWVRLVVNVADHLHPREGKTFSELGIPEPPRPSGEAHAEEPLEAEPRSTGKRRGRRT